MRNAINGPGQQQSADPRLARRTASGEISDPCGARQLLEKRGASQLRLVLVPTRAICQHGGLVIVINLGPTPSMDYPNIVRSQCAVRMPAKVEVNKRVAFSGGQVDLSTRLLRGVAEPSGFSEAEKAAKRGKLLIKE